MKRKLDGAYIVMFTRIIYLKIKHIAIKHIAIKQINSTGVYKSESYVLTMPS